ncbi:MAG: GNAT family N-acetyltransferase, partial [Candidatus Heimdallarchaeota archaeon]|nr:GNAT family N-acetyltransferase [Candidatus Heimdallarchaeota archaeon]
MKIEYRKFQEADLTKIKEFTEVMPTYYEDWNSYASVVLDEKDCVFYGAFLGEKIIGLGNLRKKTENVAWIELIRVRPDNQLKGIGSKLFQYGDEAAKKLNYKIVGFATEGGNIASCKIGEKLGFKLLTETIPFWVDCNKPKTVKIEKIGKPISIDVAFDLIQKIPDGPKDYIAIGWNFVP